METHELFNMPPGKLSESGWKVLEQGINEAKEKSHPVITIDHIFVAYIKCEWNTFVSLVSHIGIRPEIILKDAEDSLKMVRSRESRLITRFRVDEKVSQMFQMADYYASQSKISSTIEPHHILLSLLDQDKSVASVIFRKYGHEPLSVLKKFQAALKAKSEMEEYLKKKYELPPFLKHFAINMNLLARQGRIPVISGRDREVGLVMEILCHMERSNSVMLLGDAGVGKTAVAECLARMIEFEPEKVPIRLRNCFIVALEMNNVVAGTMLRGMFEERIQKVIGEIKENPRFILFIDEAHTLIGAGSALGAPTDAANIFKSVLARGEVRIIGATTSTEYKQHIQDDEALSRRFRVVYISEPSIEETRKILVNLRPQFEKNYGVKISDDAIETALDLSPRYMRNLRLPDKAISWIDTASVRTEIGGRKEVIGSDVVDVISHFSRIPKDMIFRNIGNRFLNISEALEKRVIGQKDAITRVSNRIIFNKGPLKKNFYHSDGVLMFLGPTGVGKTELAKALAEFLFGSDLKMIRLDMSEYSSAFSPDKLIGMSRGIVGSERGGTLTSPLKDEPYSVVLLDEIEKASPEVLNLFLQAFDEGWITDGRGKKIYLSDAIVVMTSNIGSDIYKRITNPLGFSSDGANAKDVRNGVLKEYEKRFSPEFRNRVDEVVTFLPLTRETVVLIADKYICEIRSKLEKDGKSLILGDGVLAELVNAGFSAAYGARELGRAIDKLICIPISLSMDKNVFHFSLKDGKIILGSNGIEKNELVLT